MASTRFELIRPGTATDESDDRWHRDAGYMSAKPVISQTDAYRFVLKPLGLQHWSIDDSTVVLILPEPNGLTRKGDPGDIAYWAGPPGCWHAHFW
jgi:hypothetical protein